MALRGASQFVLTERDCDVLVSLAKYRLLTTSQIRQLHFPSLQTAARRLRLLRKTGLVTAITAVGVGERLELLTALGAETVAAELGVAATALGWVALLPDVGRDFGLRHLVTANSFRIALAAACAAEEHIRLLGFLPPHLEADPNHGDRTPFIRAVVADVLDRREKSSHTPDGVFALSQRGRTALYFLEIDRQLAVSFDHERAIRRLLTFYGSYSREPNFERYVRAFDINRPFDAFYVLFLVSSPSRLTALQGAFRVHARGLAHVVWAATTQNLTASTIFGPRWFALDKPQLIGCGLPGMHAAGRAGRNARGDNRSERASDQDAEEQ